MASNDGHTDGHDSTNKWHLDGWAGQTLHQAAIYDNVDLLECLLQGDEKNHINSTDFSNRTPVYTAVSNGSYRSLRLLLDHGANPDISGGSRTGYMTPLHLAVTDNKVEAVRLLVSKANLELCDGEGFTALALAVATENNTIMEIITSEMARRDEKQRKIVEDLRSACEDGNIGDVKKALETAKDNGMLSEVVNDTSANLYTPLCLASRYGHIDIVLLLIQNGAYVIPQRLTNETPLHIVCEFGHTDLGVILLERFKGVASSLTTDLELPIHIAAQRGHEQLVKLLLTFPYPENYLKTFKHKGRVYRAAFDINAKDLRERTPLMYAAERGHTEVVRYLVCEYLVSSQPDPDADYKHGVNTDLSGQSMSYSRRMKQSFHRTSSRRRPMVKPEVAEGVLKICPVDLDISDQNGRTPLVAAIQLEHSALVEIILKAGATVNKVWSEGQTPLSPLVIAASKTNLDMVEMLINSGARDDDNIVFNMAMEMNNEELLAALLRLRCRKDGENPINKKAMVSKYQNLNTGDCLLGDNWSSLDLESLAVFPAASVSLEWRNFMKLETVKESWIHNVVLKLHSVSPHCSLDQNFSLFAVTKMDISGNNIKSLPQFLFKLPSLHQLEAANNKISDIGCETSNSEEDHVECPFLSRLILHHNKLLCVPEFIFKLPTLSVLDVSFNEICTLHAELWASPSLREVNLSHNKLSNLPTFVNQDKCFPSHARSHSRSSVSSVNCVNHDNSSPPTINLGTHIHTQDFQGEETFVKTPLEEDALTTEVIETELHHDVYWRTHVNVVKERPQSVKGIEILNLSHNLFSCVPPGLPCLAPHLTQLDLSNNLLTCVGSPHAYPASINQLILDHNNIWTIVPENVDTGFSQNVFCFKWVDEEGRPKTPQERRPRLSSSASSNSVVRSHVGLCHHRQHTRFISLEELSLSHNELTSLQLVLPAKHSPRKASRAEPSHVQGVGRTTDVNLLFPCLTALDVAFNKIQMLHPEIGEMTTLKSLCLNNNNIKDLPPGMGLLKKLWQLNVKNCPLEGPLREMVENESRAPEIISFLDSIREESTHYNCMNLILVGQHDIGKTSLLQLMRKDGKKPRSGILPKALHWTERTSKNGVKPKQKKGGKPLSTVGIDINELILEKKGREVTFRTWDFGGQKEYYATHQYFLSTRALYLVVWNLVGKSGMKSIWEWLVNIQARAPGSAVIIVGTHLDVLKDKKSASTFPADYEREMMEKLNEIKCMVEPEKYGLPNVLDVRNVSCKTEENIRELVSAIFDHAFQLRHPKVKTQYLLGQKIPRKYLLLQKIVTDLAQERKAQQRDPVIDSNLYKVLVMNKMTEVCGEVFRDMAELDQATRFLHENGVLCHYEDSSLRDLYFLDPQWLCDQLARVVTIQDVNRYATNGVMKVADIELSFKDSTFTPEDIKRYFINLLEKFEVALQFDSQNLLIPSMLASEHNPKLWIKIPLRKKSQEYVSIRQRKRTTYLTSGEGTPTMNVGMSKFYTGKSLSIGPQLSVSESPESRLENTPLTLKFVLSPAFTLHRLYFMTYFPSGFWPRLIIGLLADTDISDIVAGLYEPPSNWPGLTKALDKTPEWRCWKSGLELTYLGNQVLCVKEFDPDYPGMSCDFGRCDLMCPQEGDFRPVSLERASLLEITIPNFSIQTEQNTQLLEGATVSPELCIHQNFKASAKLLTHVVDWIDNLLHDWFPDIGELRMAQSMDGHYLITRLVPCSKCVISQAKRDRKERKKKQSSEWNVVDHSVEDVESVMSIRLDGVKPRVRRENLNQRLAEIQNLSQTPGADQAYCRTDSMTKTRSIYSFMVEECVLSAKLGKFINCPHHGAISPVVISESQQTLGYFHLAPDLVFADLPDDLLIRKEQVHVGRYIGHGAFGFVFAGGLNLGETDEVSVALKMLEPFDPGVTVSEELNRRLDLQKRRWKEDPMQQCTEAYLMARQELSIFQRTQHDHIMPFLGIALSPLSLVLVLAPLGALDKLLKELHDKQKRLPVHVVTHTAFQVASALKYLHSERIIYRDLKSENVLVFSFPNDEMPDMPIDVKLSDYGISRAIHSSGTKGFGGTPPFIAPEVIQQGGKTTYSEKVDCFSYGMFLYELLTCQLPFKNHPMVLNISLHVFQGSRPNISPEISRYPAYMLDLMTRCWAQEAKNRPSSAEIVEIVSSPDFSHIIDVVSLEGNVSVSAACAVHFPPDGSAGEHTGFDSQMSGSLGTDGSLGGVRKGEGYSQLWVMTRTRVKGTDGINTGRLEVFTYQHSRCEESQVIKVSCIITTMAVVNGSVWCVTNKGSVQMYCPETLQKEYQFELPPFKEQPNAIAVLHAPLHGDVIIALSNGHLLVYPDEIPFNTSESLQRKEDILCNGRRIHCAVLVLLGESYQIWVGQDHGKIAVQTLGSPRPPQEICAVLPDDPNISCIFLVTDTVMTDNSSSGYSVWAYNYPGSVIHHWRRELTMESPEVEASLDCGLLHPDVDISTHNNLHRLETVWSQVTALNVLGEYLYVGMTSGSIVVANKHSMEALHCFRCHANKEFYIKFLVPICTEPFSKNTVHRNPVSTPGIVSVGKGFCNVFDKVKEKKVFPKPSVDSSSAHAVSDGLYKTGRQEFKPREDHTYLLSWLAQGWEDTLLTLEC